jgi:hypothetical protein
VPVQIFPTLGRLPGGVNHSFERQLEFFGSAQEFFLMLGIYRARLGDFDATAV